jgi:DNA-binding LacI/PurR family transcriptional regulator
MASPAHAIGILSPFYSHPAFIQRMRGMMDALDTSGIEHHLMLFHVRTPEQIEQHINRIISTRLVNALIINALVVGDAILERLAAHGIAVVRIFDHPLPGTPTVAVDNRIGGRVATEHLIGLGHTKIGFIGEFLEDPFNFPTAIDRHAGYLDALKAHGLPVQPRYTIHPDRLPLSTLEATRRLLSLPDPPTAIFAMYDMKALRVIEAINEIGLKVPDFVSVIGFDDIDLAQYVGLTTVRQHFEAGGRMAVEMLLKLLANDPSWEEMRPPPLELVVRATTAPPNN